MSTTSIILPTTPSRSKMTSSLHNLSSSSSFEDVKTSCSKFTVKFDAWVAKARKARAFKESDFKKAFQTSLRKFVTEECFSSGFVSLRLFDVERQAELKAEIEECTRQVISLNQGKMSPLTLQNHFQQTTKY